jgi:hypothetical protein
MIIQEKHSIFILINIENGKNGKGEGFPKNEEGKLEKIINFAIFSENLIKIAQKNFL